MEAFSTLVMRTFCGRSSASAISQKTNKLENGQTKAVPIKRLPAMTGSREGGRSRCDFPSFFFLVVVLVIRP
ncbi:hypothetical protein BC443_12130 [Salinicola sp. MIT1003]|nr:hypothetical protein BC443_12130 [Salinicola sp. MIT1003]